MKDDLSNAKVGDTLCIDACYYHPGYLSKVVKITPTGRVVTDGGSVFTPSGREYGGDFWQPKHARIATAEDIAKVHRYHSVERLRKFDWNKLSDEDLETVAAIAKKYMESK